VGLRRAKLKSEFGSLYPELPAEHWVPALQLVIRRAERIWREHGAQALIGDRLLPDEHRLQGRQATSFGLAYSHRAAIRLAIQPRGRSCYLQGW
jgi:hypothetical protein